MASLLPQMAWIIITSICAFIVLIFAVAADEVHYDKQRCKLYTCIAIISTIILIISFINIWYAPDLDNFRQNVIDIRDSQIQNSLKKHMFKLTPEQRFELLLKENM